jgi:hypothetical protein
MPGNPVQADYGAQVFYQVCMVCHGDRGQGLTDEWRNVLDPEDRNCWQSRCHATNHPPDGFIFPKTVPPVVGPQVLAQFPTALSLHDYLKSRMPWQAPGTRSEDEYWQLTAFLLRLNGVDPGSEPLDETRASAIVLNPSRSASPTPAPLVLAPSGKDLTTASALWIGFGAVWLLAILGLVVALVKRRSS